MKKIGKNIILISLFLIFALLNLILFVTVDDARPGEAVFWLGWTFAFPFNFLVFVLIHLWCGKRGGDALVQMPIAYRIAFGFTFVYLALGAVLMYAPIESFTAPFVIEIAVTVVYVIVSMYAVFGATHIMSSERAVKEKVMYISMLKADVEDIMARVSDSAAKNALLELAEAVRFSDPMSHPSLGGIEAEISGAVGGISALAREGRNDEIIASVKAAKELLEARNRRCIMLK